MRKNTRSLAVLALAILSCGAAFAQPPADNLNGKTIHIYVESDNFNAFYFQNGDIPFTVDSKYNYTLKLSGRDVYQQDFFFTSNGTSPEGEHFKWKFGKTGLNVSDEGRFKVSDFQGKTEMWIVVDPAGPVTAPPIVLFEAPKTLNILNPWPTTAPRIVSGTKTRAMTTTPGRCGWFTSLMLDPAMTKIHFQEVNEADNYGSGGYGSLADFDLPALFTARGPSLWLNTESNTWSPAWPNVDGDCQYMMAATVRDFSKEHPDFDFAGLQGDFLLKGMVQPTLGPDRKPVRSAAASRPPVTFTHFDAWWKTDSTNANPALRSYESCTDIPMSKSSDGLWEYDSYRDSPLDHSFFPVEGALNRLPAEAAASCYVMPPPDTTNWKTGGPKRNGNFCMESHATFIYQKGQRFAFRGDDDVWVYIDDKLVVDLGGVHTPKSDSIDLEKISPPLVPGKEYKWDFFYCDRQPCGSSLRVKTSIFFRQQRSLFKEEIPGATGLVRFKIRKREGGKGSCASIDTATKVVDPSSLTYQLLDANGKLLETLKEGVTYGGITLATPDVTIDTNKIVGLQPGPYRLVIFEPANEKVRVEIPFRVPSRNLVEFEAPYTGTAPVGTLIMVIAANREKGALVAAAEKYVPVIPAGLDVYGDAARTVKIAAGTQLTTDATGYDTLWVTGTATATADKTYILSIPLSAKDVSLTFIVPKNRVEFEPPFARDTLVGSLVALDASNREAGLVVAKAQPYSLIIPPGLKVFSDAAMTQPILSGASISTEADGRDRLFATADSTDPVDKTYLLEIAGSAQKMTITFRMPPLDLPKAVSAGIWDDDGDGIGDRIEATYDRDISAGPPKGVGYKWPSSAAAVAVPAADIAKGVTGKVLVVKGRFSPDILTAGAGIFTSAYPARKVDSTQSLALDDHIGPIIRSAEITLGKTEDTLRIRFSETIGAVPTGASADWFGIKRMAAGSAEHVAPLSAVWKDDRNELTLIYANVAADVPRAGNLIRIETGPGLIVDERGNGAGPAARFRVITGGKRSEIQTVTFRAIAPDGSLLAEKPVAPSLQPVNAVVAEVVDRTGRMGHLIKVDLAGYAVKDDFTDVQASQVALEYHASYFTNTGVPVAEEKRTILCTDAIFSGDCVTHRGFVFVGWNYTSRDGAKVATGAYVARLRFAVRVGGVVKERGGLDQVWGILRRN